MKTLIFLLFLVACGNDDFPRVEKLDRFRVLAIEASQPEVAPGGSSSLRLFVSDIKAQVLNGVMEICLDPGIALGAPVSCDHGILSSESFSINTSTDTDLGEANRFTGFANYNPTVNVPSTILAGRSFREQQNGVAVIALFKITIEGVEQKYFTRIVATERSVLNSLPAITDLKLNNEAISGVLKENDILSATVDSPESYQIINIDGIAETRLEDYQLAWYVTSGELDRPKTQPQEVVKVNEASAQDKVVLVIILRDGRGGVNTRREVLP